MFRGLALCQSMLHLKFKEVQSKWYRLYRHLQPASKIIYHNFICRWMRITAMQCLCHTLKYTTTTFMICLMRLLWIPFVQSKLTSHTLVLKQLGFMHCHLVHIQPLFCCGCLSFLVSERFVILLAQTIYTQYYCVR